MKPVGWVIKSDRFNTILGNDGIFYSMTCVENIKFYKREGYATKRLLRLGDGFTAYALYAGETIDCLGRINHN